MPAAVLFGLFFFIPFGLIVCFSFWQDFDYKVIHHWTVENYRYVFHQPAYIRTLWATLWMAVAATGITLGLAFPSPTGSRGTSAPASRSRCSSSSSSRSGRATCCGCTHG